LHSGAPPVKLVRRRAILNAAQLGKFFEGAHEEIFSDYPELTEEDIRCLRMPRTGNGG